MPTSAPDVRVEIVNLRPNERLTYPLVLIEGRVVVVDTDTDVPSIEHITAIVSGASTATALSWPVVPETGHFKAFALLPRPGKHTVQLLVRGNVVHEFTVRYARPSTTHIARFHYQKQHDDSRGFDAPPGVDNSDEAALARTRLGALLMQTCIAELFHRAGLPRATIAIEFEEADGSERLCVTLLLTSDLSAAGSPMHVIRDALDEQDAASEASLTHFVHVGSNHYDPETSRVANHCAYSFQGVCAFSSVTLHTWPSTLSELTRCCIDTTPIDTSQLANDSGFGHCSHWANYSTGFGVFMHLFFQPFASAQTGRGMLTRGFDNSNRLLSVYEPNVEGVHVAVVDTVLEEGEPERLVLNRNMLNALGDSVGGAYMEEAALFAGLETCPFLMSANEFAHEQTNAAGAA